MKKRKLLIISLLLIGVIVSIFKYYPSLINRIFFQGISCEDTDPTTLTRKAQLIENQKADYATSTKRIFGQSTDGGVQINYKDGKEIRLIERGLYGETVNSKSSFFMENSNVYYLHEEITRFKTSIYQKDFNPEQKTIDVRDYYFDNNERLCKWYINETPQPITKEVKSYIKEYISDLN